MAITIFPEIIILLFLVLLLLLLVLHYHVVFPSFKNKGNQKWSKNHPTNWPVIGMFPWLLLNYNRVHDALTDALQQVGGTFEFRGPWFSGINILGTSDPANIRYILSRNFSNFPKGPEFSKIFDLLGDGIFSAYPKSWEAQRKATLSFLHDSRFHEFLISTIWNKLENGLIPIVNNFSEAGMVFDLQDLLGRFTFDTACMLVLGRDPNSLFVTDVPEIKAFDNGTEAVFYRYIIPEFVWKFQRWLHIGSEKKLSEGSKIVRKFISRCISLKRQQLEKVGVEGCDVDRDLLTSYLTIESPKIITGEDDSCIPETLLIDILLNVMFAGRDSISASITWLFWLLAKNPHMQDKIRQEIIANLGNFVEKDDIQSIGTRRIMFEFFMKNGAKERINHLVYLHGAACESLRLYPPVALNHKESIEDDILPSGHKVKKNTRILLSFYSMARMESIWGKDCLEFKPERWISESTSSIKHEPPFKFTAFSGGPRTCVGKEMSFIAMKMVVASIIHDYHIEVVEGHLFSTSTSVILGMKHGINVRFSKR